MFSGVASSINVNMDAHDYLFFSRLNFNASFKQTELGSELIEELFAKLNYKSIFPEMLSLDKQIFLIKSCSRYCAVSGTLIHNLFFVQTNRPQTTIVNKTYHINPYLLDTCKMLNITPLFCDFYACKYPLHIGYGPFVFTVNNNFEKYLLKNDIKLSDIKSSDLSIIKDIFIRYEYLYNKIVNLRRISVGFYDDVLHKDYFPLELYKQWFLQYSRLQIPDNCNLRYFESVQQILDQNSDLQEVIRNIMGCGKRLYLVYNIHLAVIGWKGEFVYPMPTLIHEENLRIEAIKLRLFQSDAYIYYQAYYNETGWTEISCNNEIAGTTGKSRPLHGIKIWLGDLADEYHVEYRIFIKEWSAWVADGAELLAPDGFKAMQAKLTPRKEKAAIEK